VSSVVLPLLHILTRNCCHVLIRGQVADGLNKAKLENACTQVQARLHTIAYSFAPSVHTLAH